MKSFFIFILFLFLYFSFCFADRKADYIQEFPQKFDITMYVGWDLIDLYKENTSYNPNNPVKLGLVFSISEPNLMFWGSFNITDRANPDLPKSTAYDFKFNIFPEKFMINLYFQNYHGFYTGELPEITSFPDLDFTQIGTDIMYFFNYKEFSARAAFGQTEKQLKSAGSFIFGGDLCYSQIDKENLDINFLKLGTNFGYAYIFVITENIFLSTAMTGGIGIYHDFNSNKDLDLNVSFHGMARASIGYNTDVWCFAIHALYRLQYYNNDLMVNTGNFQMAFKYRFDSIFK